MGRVTRCGLNCEVGKAAINPVPRQMIFEQVAGVCREAGFKGVLSIEIRVPEALKVADKTFNSRLGIRGGISILGTSGMVEPMSETALPDTIRLELRQRIRNGEKNLLVTPGNYGENFVGTVFGLGLGQAVKCSNFIGSTIDMAVEEGAESIPAYRSWRKANQAGSRYYEYPFLLGGRENGNPGSPRSYLRREKESWWNRFWKQ